ncbi:MAG TPA: hypothetical protein VM934_03090 [Pyrinomonadaceae bacterium]|nr:hypothetical protein [Pyrinomonadaceae bacterium]
MSDVKEEKADAASRASFYAALGGVLAGRGLSLESFCSTDDVVTHRLLKEYGAMFVAEGVLLPPVCAFTTDEEVVSFQREATWRAADFGGVRIELQPAALDALLRAREEARAAGLDITPRDGAEAGRRSFDDSLRLWASRCEPAIDHWCAQGRLTFEQAGDLRELPLREQVAAVLELEEQGLFFSKDFSKSILYSVAAPGASQHLAMLAFDAVEFRDERVRRMLSRHGWFQTVQSDLPHFTFLGLAESELPARGLRAIETCGQVFWIPDTEEIVRQG